MDISIYLYHASHSNHQSHDILSGSRHPHLLSEPTTPTRCNPTTLTHNAIINIPRKNQQAARYPFIRAYAHSGPQLLLISLPNALIRLISDRLSNQYSQCHLNRISKLRNSFKNSPRQRLRISRKRRSDQQIRNCKRSIRTNRIEYNSRECSLPVYPIRIDTSHQDGAARLTSEKLAIITSPRTRWIIWPMSRLMMIPVTTPGLYLRLA